jgi:hypothetical protein
MMRLTQRSWTADRTEVSSDEATAEMKVTRTAVIFYQSLISTSTTKTRWKGTHD